jgi:catechol 2,3-dioxygenase-like lactoylglutathione lyase family enzyme
MQSTITKISTAVAYTALASTDLNRSERFYRDSLGFDVERIPRPPEGLTVRAGKGTGFTVYERPTPPTCDTTAMILLVDDIESAMSDVRSHGVVFEEYDLPYLKTTNGVAVQGSSKASWFKDPDGNIVSLVQM